MLIAHSTGTAFSLDERGQISLLPPLALLPSLPADIDWSRMTIDQVDFTIRVIPDDEFRKLPAAARAHIERSNHWTRCTAIQGWRNKNL